jgi:hypothetical protein
MPPRGRRRGPGVSRAGAGCATQAAEVRAVPRRALPDRPHEAGRRAATAR